MKATPVFNPPASAELTQGELDAQRALNNEKLATENYVSRILAGFREFWGTPGNVIDRDRLNAMLAALGKANWIALATRHAAAMQYLSANQMIEDVEPWQLTTPYEVNVDGDVPVLEEALNPAWEAPAS